MFYFSTDQLEMHIKAELEKIEFTNFDALFFGKNTPNSNEGTYIFSDDNSYHYVFSEKGTETTHKVTDNVFEITYWTIAPIVFDLALNYMITNIKPGEIQRKVIFEKSLEIMKNIGENYFRAQEIQISEILKRNPYID